MRTRRAMLTLAVMMVLLVTVACSAAPTDGSVGLTVSPPVTFFALIKPDTGGQVAIDLGLSVPTGVFDHEEPLNAYWRLVDAEGVVLAHGFVERVPTTPGGSANEKMLDRWEGALAVGDYAIEWGAPGFGSTLHQFEVLSQNGRIVIGDHDVRISAAFPPSS
jgi:hypothetical protein